MHVKFLSKQVVQLKKSLVVTCMCSFHTLSHAAFHCAFSPPFQVRAFRALMSFEKDEGELHRDSWGIKKLFSYGCHKSGGDKDLNTSPIRRVPQLNFPGSKHAKFQFYFLLTGSTMNTLYITKIKSCLPQKEERLIQLLLLLSLFCCCCCCCCCCC